MRFSAIAGKWTESDHSSRPRMALGSVLAVLVLIVASVVAMPFAEAEPSARLVPLANRANPTVSPSEDCRFAKPSEWESEMAMMSSGRRGWLASDGYVSTPLANGDVLLLMGDTLVGRSSRGRVRTGDFVGTQRNSAVIYHPGRTKSQGCFSFTHSGLGGPMSNPAHDPARQWHWPNKAIPVRPGDNRIFAFAAEFKGASDRLFDFQQTGVSVFELTVTGDRITRRSERELRMPTVPDVNWGWAVEREGAWVYVYGVHWREGESFTRELYLARLPQSTAYSDPSDTSAWEMLGEAGWIPGRSARLGDLKAISSEVGAGGTVHRVGGKWQLVTRPAEMIDHRVMLMVADNPWGPFQTSREVKAVAPAGHWLYNAQAHPAIPAPRGKQWVSVDRNTETLPTTAPLSTYQARWMLMNA